MFFKTKSKKTYIDPNFIIPQGQHSIAKNAISPNAITVLSQLNRAGFEAYLVGGGVRDLLLRKKPKDFDVATNATPNEIKRLFRNARIIGRRFKLVHIIYHREIIEVSTFRTQELSDSHQHTNEKGMLVRDNAFGSLKEDAWRRDFTINSLYYKLDDGSIIDYTGGFKDISRALISIIGHAETRYQEDPVRMLRAIRFSAQLNFKLSPDTESAISIQNELISHISSSRLFEETTKLFQCGKSQSAYNLLKQYGLFAYLFPQTNTLLNSSSQPVDEFILISLESTDNRLRDNKPVNPAFIYAVLLWFPVLNRAEQLRHEQLEPIPAFEKAMSDVISVQNKVVTIPKRHTQVMREIWLLQYRFPKRLGTRAHTLLQNPRFRAAYDFLALRALIGDESIELAQWWSLFQDADEQAKTEMIDSLAKASSIKRKAKLNEGGYYNE